MGNPNHDAKGEFSSGSGGGAHPHDTARVHAELAKGDKAVEEALRKNAQNVRNVDHKEAVSKQMRGQPAKQNNRQIDALSSVPSSRFTKGK